MKKNRKQLTEFILEHRNDDSVSMEEFTKAVESLAKTCYTNGFDDGSRFAVDSAISAILNDEEDY